MSIYYHEQQMYNCRYTQHFQIHDKCVYYSHYSNRNRHRQHCRRSCHAVMPCCSCDNEKTKNTNNVGGAANNVENYMKAAVVGGDGGGSKMYQIISCDENAWLKVGKLNQGLLGYLIQNTNYDGTLNKASNNNNSNGNNYYNNGIKSILLLLIIIFSFCINNAGGEILHHRKMNSHSHADGMKGKTKALPNFMKVPEAIEVMAGQTVILSCKVENLEDRMVLWMRTSDLQVLTAGDITFTHDQRFHSEYPHGGDNSWGLIIKNVQHKDAGRYECQINTEPKMKRYVNLVVKDNMQQMDTPFYGTSIDGGKEQNVKANSSVSLTCRSTLMEHQTGNDELISRRITWYKDDDMLNEKKSRSGIYIETEWNFPTVISKLILATVAGDDTGIYTCTTVSGSDSIQLYVIEEGKLGPLRSSSCSLNEDVMAIFAVYLIFRIFLC